MVLLCFMHSHVQLTPAPKTVIWHRQKAIACQEKKKAPWEKKTNQKNQPKIDSKFCSFTHLGTAKQWKWNLPICTRLPSAEKPQTRLAPSCWEVHTQRPEELLYQGTNTSKLLVHSHTSTPCTRHRNLFRVIRDSPFSPIQWLPNTRLLQEGLQRWQSLIYVSACFHYKHFHSITEKKMCLICQLLRLLLSVHDCCHPVTQEKKT